MFNKFILDQFNGHKTNNKNDLNLKNHSSFCSNFTNGSIENLDEPRKKVQLNYLVFSGATVEAIRHCLFSNFLIILRILSLVPNFYFMLIYTIRIRVLWLSIEKFAPLRPDQKKMYLKRNKKRPKDYN